MMGVFGGNKPVFVALGQGRFYIITLLRRLIVQKIAIFA